MLIKMSYLTEENGVANGYGPTTLTDLPFLEIDEDEITGPILPEAIREFLTDESGEEIAR